MYVYELSLEKMQALAALMDVDGAWEDAAAEMKGEAKLVLLLRQAQARGESPTTYLLRVYGSRGHPIENLARLFTRIRHLQALQLLKDSLNPELYQSLVRKMEPSSAEKSALKQRDRAASSSTGRSPYTPASLLKKDGEDMNSLSSQASTSSTTASLSSSAGLANTLRVTYQELRAATQDFAAENLIGKGGYGMVYKGVWKHNRVAVKRITSRHKSPQPNSQEASDAEKERVRQSLSELRTLGLYRHDHVLPLYAYSLDGPEPLLLYQLMANGSLEASEAEKERVRQSLSELRTLGLYRHDHVLPLYAYSLDGPEPLLLYQLMANGSLEASEAEKERVRQSLSELRMLGLYRHDHVLPLYAYSLDGPEPLLLYQLMANGSLEASEAEKERVRQSLSELRTLGLYRHDHVLPLYAYSLDGPEPLLLYQLMANGSLEASEAEKERVRQSLSELRTLGLYRHYHVLPLYAYSLDGPEPLLLYQLMANGSLEASEAEKERVRQSLSELRTLGLYRHYHVLPLYAYSLDGPEPLLLYQLMANGSLEASEAEKERVRQSLSELRTLGLYRHYHVLPLYAYSLDGPEPLLLYQLMANGSLEASEAEKERVRQSLSELRTLGLYRHDHVLPLYAYSLDGPEPLLLYQLMANGSLEASEAEKERVRQSLSELRMLGLYRHDHVLPLYAYSLDGPEPLLLYQLMANGSLEASEAEKERVRQSLSELRTLGLYRHDHVLPLYAYSLDGPEPLLLYQLMANGSLEASEAEKERVRQSLSELRMLGLYRHDHVLPLYAYSLDGPEPLLLYQLMANGSLEASEAEKERVRQSLSELRTLGLYRHDHVLPLYAYSLDGPEPLLLYQLMANGSLEASEAEKERVRQSLSELRMLGLYRHDHVLPLYAYSLDGPEPLLLYQLMANGSLEASEAEKERVRQSLSELRTLGLYRHDHVLPLYAYSLDGPEPLLLYQLMANGSLEASEAEKERVRQSLSELRMLGLYRHDHVLPLYAYSLDGPEPLLLYQLMANGSLEASEAEKERVRQSLSELRTLGLYRHDHVLPLYAYSLDGPEPLLLYQLMANGSLEASEAEKERVRQSLSELRTLGLYRHDHVLPLYAYSLDGPEPLLLYQLMANGSLEASEAEKERVRQSLSELRTLGLYRHDHVLPLYAYSLDGPEPLLLYQLMANGSLEASEAEKERVRQSLSELRTLGLYRHDHVLPLYAYSLDGPEPLLLYQLMANGSLEDRLLCRSSTPPLLWPARRRIVAGAARGLHFLHDTQPEPLVHGDIKSANILLDEHFQPKLGDFGLCRVGKGAEAEPLIVSHIKGTLAYLPPEFLRSKHLSTKLDVYSFGVVLLEVGTGQRAYSEQRQPEGLVEYIRKVGTGEADKKGGDEDAELGEELLREGLAAASPHPQDRPSIDVFLSRFVRTGL